MVNDKETIQNNNLSISQANHSKKYRYTKIRIANILGNMMHPSVMTNVCIL